MADTSVPITAGSGTDIDTRTESTNGNHRQVVVLGDPATNAGVAPVDGTAGLKVDLGADNDVVVSGTVAVTGVATAANQTTTNSNLATIATNTGNIPASPSTSALQTTGNSSLSTIATNTGAATPAGTNVIGKVGIDQTTPGTTNLVALAANQSVNQAQVAGTTTATNTGNASAGTQRVVLATDQPTVSTYIKPDATDNSLLGHTLIAAASTNATSVKASAGKTYYISLSNSDTVGYWFKMYNKASAPTVGTDVPISTRYIPAGGGREIPIDVGNYYSTGIAYAITLNATDADTTAVTNANKVTVQLRYI